MSSFFPLLADSSIEALAAEVKVMQDDQPNAFQSRVREIYQKLSPQEWGYFLEQLLTGSQPISKALDKADFTLARICQALQSAPHHRGAYLTLRSLVTEDLLSSQQASSAILEAATQLESVEGKGQRQSLQISLKLREIAFELDPLQKDNVEKLLIHAVDSEDDLSVMLYGQALLECLDEQTTCAYPNTVRIEESSQSVKALTLLLDKGYIDLFFAIANSLIPLLQEAQKTAFIGLLSQLATIFSPDKAKDYDGLYKVEDLITTEFNQLVGAISYNSASNYYSLIGDRLLALADENKSDFIIYLALLAESLEKLIRTSKSEKIKDIIDKITEHLSSHFLEDWQVTFENLPDSLTIARVILSRVAFCWSYVSDDRSLIRRYQQLGGRILSQTLNLMARQRNFTWLEHWEKQKSLYKAHKKPHIGYLGSCFQRHSVGFLSESSLRLQNRGALDVSYYYFWGHSTEEIASHDNLYQRFSSHDHLFFRILPKGTPIPKVVSQAREDQVDIMIFMDSLTIHEANMSAALRCAPIQIGWLGGDAVGLPEFDYFLADPHILPEDAQVDYQEKIIRLPSYCATDSLDFFPLGKDEFKSKLNVKPNHLLLLTASSAYKRTSECIEAHLRITKEVKNAILIVKVSGEISTVISRYKTKAKELGVDEKIRFLATTKTAEEHRGQLGCIDLILDTFPYTGATHTMEALYMGVPVLTLVGRHYYGRMSYSLLKNIGLEDCITWSVEEFIQRGIQLGNDPERINRIKKQIKDSRRWSIIWDPREHARSMEAAFFHILEGKPHEAYVFHPNDLYSSPDEWNQAGIQLIRSLSADASVATRQSTWEEALSLWRRGLARDPYHVPCWLNRIHALLVLGDRSRAFEDAYALLKFLCTEARDLQPSQLIDVPIWVQSKGFVDPGAYTKHTYLYYLAKWMAAHIGVVYSPEAMRFWNLTYSINPDDVQAALAVGVELLSQRKIEGLVPINRVLTLDPGHQLASLAKQIAMWEVVPQVRTASLPGQPDLYLDYENFRLSLEPSFSSIVTRVLLTQGEWFEEEVDFCRHFLKAGMNVIDVGANVGVYTFLAARRVGPTGSVIAVEPTTSCIQHLQKTISSSSLENVVSLVESAAGDHEGTVQFQEERATVFNSISDPGPVPEQRSRDEKVVSLTTLDSIWRSRGKPQIDLIKIDAEGAEEQVISGALELLAATQSIVIFENISGSKVTGAATAKILEPLGYGFYTYNRFLNKLTKVKPQQYPVSALNIIAIHPSSLEKVADMIPA